MGRRRTGTVQQLSLLDWQPADKRHVVCFSGGEGSAMTAVEVVRRFGAERTVLLNHDLHPRVEDADIKRFKREVAAAIGVPITYANHSRYDEWDQFDVVMDAQAFKVGTGSELCTSRLKTEPFARWLASDCPPSTKSIIYYGFGPTETARITRRVGVMASLGYATDYPLALWPRTIQSTRELGIEPPLAYARFKHANCVGCLKAGRQHWYVVFCTRPDVWQKARLAEDDIGYTIINGISLEELEPLFIAMREAGVEATEHVPASRFWADAKRLVRGQRVEAQPDDMKPCECTTRKRRRCSCRSPGSMGHALSCERSAWAVAA